MEEQEPYRRIQQALENSGVAIEDVAKVFSECLRGSPIGRDLNADGRCRGELLDA